LQAVLVLHLGDKLPTGCRNVACKKVEMRRFYGKILRRCVDVRREAVSRGVSAGRGFRCHRADSARNRTTNQAS
jgi:hypothetical protein